MTIKTKMIFLVLAALALVGLVAVIYFFQNEIFTFSVEIFGRYLARIK